MRSRAERRRAGIFTGEKRLGLTAAPGLEGYATKGYPSLGDRVAVEAKSGSGGDDGEGV